MLPRGAIYSQSFFFPGGRGQSGAHDCRGVCALGVARGQADAPLFVMGARFGEAAWAQCARGPGAFSRGRILPGCLGGLNFLLPEIVIGVAYMTVEAFLLSGIVSSKYCRERQVVAN